MKTRSTDSINRLGQFGAAVRDGGLAGAAASLPMLAAMHILRHGLPGVASYFDLPPTQVTWNTLEKAGIERPQSDTVQNAVTLASHIGYGAAMGAGYGSVAGSIPLPPPMKGMLFGLGVWAVSYLGWLPAADIIPLPSRQPASRHAQLIVSHLVWGALLGWMSRR